MGQPPDVLDCEAKEGDELEISSGEIFNRSTGKGFKTISLPPAAQAIIDAGGLIAYARRRLQQRR